MSTSTVLSPAGGDSGLVAVDRLDEQEVALAHAAAERPDEVALREEVASVSDDRPTPPEERATQTDAIARPSDAARDDHSAGGEAVALTNDPTAANDPSDAESQPEWGVAPDDFHAGSSDDTSDDDDSQHPDIPGGEEDGAEDSDRPEVEGINDSDVAGTLSPDGGEVEAPAASSTEASQAGSAAADEAADDEEQRVPHLNSKVLDQLLDESSGDLVAIEDFDGEVNDRAFESHWLGWHPEHSLAAIRAKIARRKGYTAHVDDVGKLLSDPDEYRLAVELGVQITLCVHRALTNDQKIEFILRSQVGNRFRTEKEDRELKKSLMLVWIRLGVDYKLIAKRFSVCPNTVRNVETRAAADPNSKFGITKRPDGRLSPENLQKVATARELRAAGLSNPDIASLLDIDLETVGKLLKDPTSKAKKKDKHKPVAATQSTEDLAASDGVPEPHRSSLNHLNKDATAFTEWLKSTAEQARKDSEATFGHVDSAAATADDLEKLNKSILYHIQRANLETARLRQIVSGGGEAKVQEAPPADSGSDVAGPTRVSDCLCGIVESNEAGEVSIALPVFSGGVIDNSNDFLAIYGPPEAGQAVRVRVVGFDRKRGLWKLQPLGHQTAMPTDSAAASGPSHDVSTPDAEDAAGEADAETTEVST